MAFAGAAPAALGRVHRRYLTPHVSTIAIGLLAIALYVPLAMLSENFLYDTLSALSLLIAFYYSLTGFARVIYYRKALFKSAKNLLFIGVAPLLGAGLLAYLLVRSVLDLSDPGASYTGGSLFGLGLPLLVGLGFLLLGAILMFLWRALGNKEFVVRRPETVPSDGVVRVRLTDTASAPTERG